MNPCVWKTGFLWGTLKENVAKENTPTRKTNRDKKRPFPNFFHFCAAGLASVGEQPESGEKYKTEKCRNTNGRYKKYNTEKYTVGEQ